MPEVTVDAHEKYRAVNSVCFSTYESTMSHITYELDRHKTFTTAARSLHSVKQMAALFSEL